MLSLLIHYKYLALFTGAFFSGESILIAGLYFALRGDLNFYAVIIVTFFALIFSEICWYWIGRFMTYNDLKKTALLRGSTKYIDSLEHFFERHGLLTLFYSKFIYGTRTIVQLLCGIHNINFAKYVVVNTIGIVIVEGGLVSLVLAFNTSLRSLRQTVHGVEIAVSAAIVVIIILHIVIKNIWDNYIKKK